MWFYHSQSVFDRSKNGVFILQENRRLSLNQTTFLGRVSTAPRSGDFLAKRDALNAREPVRWRKKCGRKKKENCRLRSCTRLVIFTAQLKWKRDSSVRLVNNCFFLVVVYLCFFALKLIWKYKNQFVSAFSLPQFSLKVSQVSVCFALHLG